MSVAEGEEDAKGSALAKFARDVNGSMEASNDSMGDRQSEATAGKFGSEERVEDLGLGFRRHAATGIGHRRSRGTSWPA